MSWTKPPFCFMISRLTGVHSKKNFRTSIQPCPSALLFAMLPFHCDNSFFSHLKHGIQYKSLVKNFIWNARLIKYRKINRNHEGKMKGYNIDSVELFSIVFKGITIQFHDPCKCFCTLILNKSMWSAFTQCWRRRGILSENDLA